MSMFNAFRQSHKSAAIKGTGKTVLKGEALATFLGMSSYNESDRSKLVIRAVADNLDNAGIASAVESACKLAKNEVVPFAVRLADGTRSEDYGMELATSLRETAAKKEKKNKKDNVPTDPVLNGATV